MKRALVVSLFVVATTWVAPAATPAVRPFAPLDEFFHSYGDGGSAWQQGDPRSWTGGDSTFSVLLPDGRTVWIFSDTFLSPTNGCGVSEPQPCHRRRVFGSPLVNNTFVVQDGNGTATTLHGGTAAAPAALIRPPAPIDARSFYWMGDGTVEGDELVVFVRRYPVLGTLPPSAEATDVAVFSLPDLRLVRIEQGLSAEGIRPWAFLAVPVGSVVPVTWGAAILEQPDFTYVYGTEEYPLHKWLHVARAPAGRMLDAPWEYYTGTGWSPRPIDSARVLGNVAGELSVVDTGESFRLVTSELGIGDIVMHTAPAPQGPWGARLHLYSPPESARGASVYNAHEHPQFAQPGTFVVSYNVNGELDGKDVWEDIHVYRPRFVEVSV